LRQLDNETGGVEVDVGESARALNVSETGPEEHSASQPGEPVYLLLEVVDPEKDMLNTLPNAVQIVPVRGVARSGLAKLQLDVSHHGGRDLDVGSGFFAFDPFLDPRGQGLGSERAEAQMRKPLHGLAHIPDDQSDLLQFPG